MVAPPVTPALNEIETSRTPPETPVILGAPGVENGVADCVDDEVPEPAAFTARICNEYVVPLTKLLITNGLDVAAAVSQAVQLAAFTRYS